MPAPSLSKSGVTIATGFDLGQRNEDDLKRLGLGDNLISKLKPYLGMQGVEAKRYLDKHPLAINDAQAEAIDRAVKAQHVKLLTNNYNAEVKNDKKFSDLPSEAQTVIASVSFQYGANLKARTPKFWGYVISQDWEKAVSTLRNFGDAYPTRRRREAELLEGIEQ